MPKPQENPEVRIKKANREITEVLKKYNLKLSTKWDFPAYRELPIEVQLAIKVIEKHDGILLSCLTDPLQDKNQG